MSFFDPQPMPAAEMGSGALPLWSGPGDPDAPVRLEPVFIEHVRVCHFKRKPDEDGHKKLGCARCGKAKRDPDHLGAPESFNLFASSSWSLYQEAKKRWANVLAPLLTASNLPRDLASLLVEGEAVFPDRQRRDQGNYRVIIEKALGDTLTAGGWLPDDDWSRYEFGNLTASYEKGVSATRLVLFPTLSAAQ